MLLHQDPVAPNPRRVRIFAAEKEIALELRDMNVMKGEHKTDDFLAKNPVARVPVLELDDGRTICESIAICRYLEALQPKPALMGETALDQALIEQWQRWIEQRLFDPVSQAFRHGYPGAVAIEPQQIKEWALLNKGRAEEMLDFLETRLEGRDFIATDTFSIADITLLCALGFLRAGQLALGDGHPNLKRYQKALEARASAGA